MKIYQYQTKYIDEDDIYEAFVERYNVRFEIRAIDGDGEVLAKYTGTSADDVSGYAELLDEQIVKMAIENKESEQEMQDEAQMQEEMDRE